MSDPMQMIADGMTYRDVSKATGRSTSWLHTKFQASGLKRNKRPNKSMKAKTLKAVRLVQGSMNYRDAAAETGASLSSISRAIHAGHGKDET